ncbi:MAG TPA: metallophosphoesterase family protein [Gemmataceae bacterium]|nr:metallophosphoesterase family protein [Gemmataceae bacterium]
MSRPARQGVALLAVVAAFSVAVLLRPGRTLDTDATARGDSPAVGPPPSPFVISPYLQYPTQTSITVMWETAVAGTSVVEYGPTPAALKTAEAEKDATIHEVKIDGLEPETKYVYRVSTTAADGKTVTSPLYQFMTAVKEGSAFSFAVIGDTQKNPKMTAKVAKVMYDRRPHFVVHCGDVVDNGPDKKEWVHELFGPCAELFARSAVFPTIGNHEKNHEWYYKYFSLPAPEYRYRYRYGNADFFVVDSNKPLKPESEQFKWLDEQLGDSTAKWKFVYHHHPAWSSDSDDYGNTYRGAGWLGDLNVRNLVGLYEKHKVDVVFNGHIHLYERTWPLRAGQVDQKNGVVYVTSGGGGGWLDDVGPLPTWFKAQVRVDFHCCYVNVHGGRLEFKAFDHNGQLFDQFELDK